MTREELIPVLQRLNPAQLKDGPTAVVIKSWGRPKPLVVEQRGENLRISTCGLLRRCIMTIPKREIFPVSEQE